LFTQSPSQFFSLALTADPSLFSIILTHDSIIYWLVFSRIYLNNSNIFHLNLGDFSLNEVL